MFPWFRRTPDKEALQGVRRVRVCGSWFKIRKLNPIVDFPASAMPQIFSSFQSRRKKDEVEEPTEAQARRALSDMYAVVQAGLVEPALVPVGNGTARRAEPGITVEDIFRDQEVGVKLYWEIVIHSMNRFRGLKGFFFILKMRHSLLTLLPNVTAENQPTSPSPTGVSA